MDKNTPLRIKFPIGYCVPTRKLSKLDVRWLESLMVMEGFTLVKRDPADYLHYEYLGVNHYGDIMYYSKPCSYLPLGEESGGKNVLHSTFVGDYTSQFKEVSYV